MSLPKIYSLTETDVKILLSLVQKQTLEDVSRVSGIKFSYARNRITKLKNKGFIKEVGKDGQASIYETCRLPETDSLFELKATASPNGHLYHIPYFYGQNLTIEDAVRFVSKKKTELGIKLGLFSTIQLTLAVLKVRSHRKFTGEISSQRPNEELMREILGKYIKYTELELALAKELYKTDFLWSGHQNIWKVLSEGEPKESTIINYNKANQEWA